MVATAPSDTVASCGERDPESLEVAESQLALYARDLKQAMEAERAKAEELEKANARLRPPSISARSSGAPSAPPSPST